MVTIVVRGSKDRDAVECAIDRFYGGDPALNIVTLGGARKCDDISFRVSEIANSVKDVCLVLLGKENLDCLPQLEEEAPTNVYIHVVPRKKVRNLRIEHLAWEIARAKAMIRTTVYWLSNKRCYALYRYGSGTRLEMELDPAFDTFLLLDRGARMLESIIGVPCSLPLLLRKYGGEHDVYCCDSLVARIVVPDELKPILLKEVFRYSDKCVPSLEDTLMANAELSKLVIDRGINIVQRFSSGFGRVVVPFSGGKDSALCLYIAVKALGSERITAVYVDTGVEFPQTREYVEKMASDLGVELVKVKAPIRDEILRGRELPTHEHRWCTELKIAAIERFVRSLNNRVLVIIGDRDSESRSRSWRASVRDEGSVRYVAPIKPWSTAQVQVTLMNVGLELNPLYLMGFYRVGCYICPSLRSWELEVILRNEREFSTVLSDELFKRFERLKRSKS